jgi:hypothetical protein
LTSICSDSLERLEVQSVPSLGDKALSAWKLPPKLKRLSLPYWTPEDAVAYVRRLKHMPAREHSLYQTVRFLNEATNRVRRLHEQEQANINNREEIAIIGGIAQQFDDVNGTSAARDASKAIQESLRQERTMAGVRRASAKHILAAGRNAQKELGELLAAGTVTPECAVQTQLKLYATSGEILPSLRDRIERDSLQLPQLNYTVLKRLADR